MTPTDHANTVADLVGDVRASLNDPERKTEASRKKYHAAHVALDALQAQAEHWHETANALALSIDGYEDRAEAAEAERDQSLKDAADYLAHVHRLEADRDRQVKESLRIADERDRLADALREIVADEQGWAEEIASAALAHTEQP